MTSFHQASKLEGHTRVGDIAAASSVFIFVSFLLDQGPFYQAQLVKAEVNFRANEGSLKRLPRHSTVAAGVDLLAAPHHRVGLGHHQVAGSPLRRRQGRQHAARLG